MMKKFYVVAIPLFVLLCVSTPSMAQIRVISNTDNSISNSAGVDIAPIDGKMDPYDPFGYLTELRAKTMDQYAEQIATSFQQNLGNSSVEMLQSVTDYVIPSIEAIKENFYTVVQSFGFSDVNQDTLVGDFVDKVGQSIDAKISSLSAIEQQILGIYYSNESVDRIKSISRQTIWTLENLTTQKFYTEFYNLMQEYNVWSMIKREYYDDNRDPNAGKPVVDPLTPEDSTGDDGSANNTKGDRQNTPPTNTNNTFNAHSSKNNRSR